MPIAVVVGVGAQAIGVVGPPAAIGASRDAIEFFARTPQGTASCAIYSHYAGSTEAFCEGYLPGRESKATVNARGKVSICASSVTRSNHCRLGNAGDGTPTFPAGHKVSIGHFRCVVTRSGVRCVVTPSGKGFLFNPNKATRVGPRSSAASVGAPCTKRALEAAMRAAHSHARIASKRAFACDRGFAYAFAVVGSGGGGYEENLLFRAHGRRWKVVSRATYCNKPIVPARIKRAVCYSS